MMTFADSKKRIAEASDSIDKRKAEYKNRQAAILHKPQAAINMIHDALLAGIQGSYVPMDTWFTNEPFIQAVIVEDLNVIGILKDNKQRYHYNGKLYNLKQLAMLVNFNICHNVFGSLCVKTGKEKIPVKLVFVRNRDNYNGYIIILSSDCPLTGREIIRTYGNRWSIKVLFRTSKSLLNLETEFQGLSYDMTVSSTAIVFTRYILLEWLRRKSNDQKTICELFYVCCDDIQDMELSTVLNQIVKILCDGFQNKIVAITIEIKVQLINWFVSRPTFIKALCQDLMWEG